MRHTARMLSILLQYGGDPLSLRLDQLELRAPMVGLTRSRYTRCRFIDGSTVGTRRGDAWSKAVLVLDGELQCSRTGRVLRRGDVVVSPRWRDDAVLPISESSDAVKISWRAQGLAGDRAPSSAWLRLSSEAIERVTDALAFEQTPPEVALRRAQVVLAELQSLGVPVYVGALPDASAQTSLGDRLVAAAIPRIVFPLSSRPMLTDLSRELGVSERQAIRHSTSLFRRCYASVDSWRDFAAVWRITVGALMLSRSDLPLPFVAQTLGFTSTTTLCHAFDRIGWASPMVIRATLAKDERRASF